MTADEVRALIARLGTTQAGLARMVGVREDTVRQEWCRHGVPDKGTARTLLAMMSEQIIASPPARLAMEHDRDGPCGEVIDPHMDMLFKRAQMAGWHPAEISAAILSWTVHTMVDGAGIDAACETLSDAIEATKLTRALLARDQ